jgi:hypothetical protein
MDHITRTFIVEQAPEIAYLAHSISIDIHKTIVVEIRI